MRITWMRLVLIAFFLMLQACGQGNVAPIMTPISTATVFSEPTATETPVFEFSPIPLKAGFGFRAFWLELYFTDPTSPFSAQNSGGLDGPLSAAIVAARESVDVAFNSLGVNSITEALLRVHNRGVTVRVVMEANNAAGRLNPQELMDAGIPIAYDNRDGVMNDRFVIIDHSQVWTGSLNYTSSGVFKENNNLIRIMSKEIADNYTKEFEEMFLYDQFGPNVVPETPNPTVNIQGTQVEVLFSPDDVVVSRLVQLLGEAQESIYFLAYAFNSNTLGSVIRDRAVHNVNVVGVMEATQASEEFGLFKQAGLDVRLGNASEVMNHKVIIIDGRIVVMGSYDFTDKAENENDENVLIIDNEKVAQKFMEEFQRIQSRAQP